MRGDEENERNERNEKNEKMKELLGKQWIKGLFSFLLLIPFLWILSTVWAVSHELGNGVVSGKWFWFYACFVSAAIAASFSLFLNKKSSIRLNLTDILVVLFAFSVFFLTPRAEGISQKQTLLVLIICLYFLFRIILNTQKSAFYFLSVFFLLTGLIESLYGLGQLYGWGHSHHSLFKITGSFFNPGPYSGYVAMTIPMALYYVLKDWYCMKDKFNKRLLPFYLRCSVAVCAVVSGLLVLPATMSRAAWIGLLGGCGLVVVYFFLQNKSYKLYIQQHKKQLILIAGIIATVVILSLIGMYGMKKDSADGRALIWKVSLPLIVKHPMGVGIGNFSGSYGDAQADYFKSEEATEREKLVAGNPEYAFNEYLQLPIELGIIPFILFLSIVLYSLIIGVRKRKTGTTGSLLALLLFAGMSYPFSVLPFLIGLVFLLAALNTQNQTRYGLLSNVVSGITLFVCLVLIGVGLKNVYPTYQAYKDWNQAKMLYNTGIYSKASKEYSELCPFLSDQITFLFEYGQCLSKSTQYNQSNEVLEKATRISCDPMLYNVMGKNFQAMKNYPKAEECFWKAAHLVPSRIYPYYLLANMYWEAGNKDQAISMARLVLEKEPKVNSMAIKEIKEKMKKLIEQNR